MNKKETEKVAELTQMEKDFCKVCHEKSETNSCDYLEIYHKACFTCRDSCDTLLKSGYKKQHVWTKLASETKPEKKENVMYIYAVHFHNDPEISYIMTKALPDNLVGYTIIAWMEFPEYIE